ncbi:S8 family serine peptidase [Paenibacillus alba]|uniref:S8 family peptidase n=1 Tax=Paenibacillus alba TaxID=1197127 RepID=UPI001565368D|nr:S8 family peptidase [Paenibacillus alba]NQX67315.1 S8 family serine peptidase [Paenibacillus alba]
MIGKWKKKVSTLALSSVLLCLLPFGGVVASPTDNVSVASNWVILDQNIRPISVVAVATTQSDSTQSTLIDDEQRVIVTFKEKKKVDKSLIKGKIKREQKHSASISAKMTSKEIEKLKKDTTVQSVEPDIQLQIASTQAMDWGVSVVNATYAWKNGYTGKGVKVAVLDSGIDTHHEDLVVSGGASFVDYTTSYDDDFGHGTHVAGIIGAKNNDIGVVGVAPDADLFAVKVLDSTGKGYLSDVIAGIDYAVENKMDIINMSITTSVDSPALHNAVDQAYASGLLLVAAAGNTGNVDGTGDTLQYPAKYSSVIAVGAVDQNNQRASFSATGNELEIVAPGMNVNSTYLNNGYKTFKGTSMASSFVSGEIALLKQENSLLTNTQLRSALDQHVLNSGNTAKDLKYGYGVLDVSALINQHTIINSPNVSGNVYSNVYGNLNTTSALIFSAGVDSKINVSINWGPATDVTTSWPSLVNAKSIAYYQTDGGTQYRYVLYYDNTIKVSINWGPATDVTTSWPSLVNARAISYYQTEGGTLFRYVLYNDNTIKVSINGEPATDVTTSWPSLVNARAISYYQTEGGTSFRFVGYLNQNPIININNTSTQIAFKNSVPNTVSIYGVVSDLDNDSIIISATIGGVTKSTIVHNTSTIQNWALQWNVNNDNLTTASYNNVFITASDNYGGVVNTTSAPIIIDNIPNIPSSLNPGGATSSIPSLVTVTPLTLNWTFSDPDDGDTQSAYDVQIYDASGFTLINDSGWVNSGSTSYTIPANKLVRGTTYSWKVAVKDSKGGVSSFSPLYYFKTNNLPTAVVTSYTDGQTISDNVLNFTWTYTDTDGQAQTSYRIQGSKDNWATIGYDSGVKTGAATSFATPAIPDGTWNFKINVNDSMEWSTAATRNNLIVPNAYEPNDTSAQAFGINYNTPYTSSISSANDVDFFKYVAPAAGMDRVTLTIPTGKNYDVYVYDASMNFVASGQIGTVGAGEETIYKVTSGATYYIKVVGVSGDYSGNPYTLKVNKYSVTNQTNYQFDSNGNITSKTTTSN